MKKMIRMVLATAVLMFVLSASIVSAMFDEGRFKPVPPGEGDYLTPFPVTSLNKDELVKMTEGPETTVGDYKGIVLIAKATPEYLEEEYVFLPINSSQIDKNEGVILYDAPKEMLGWTIAKTGFNLLKVSSDEAVFYGPKRGWMENNDGGSDGGSDGGKDGGSDEGECVGECEMEPGEEGTHTAPSQGGGYTGNSNGGGYTGNSSG
ncbi:hypothetical protein [Paenibacillus spongiae]|uniref:Uncharacterized protein n=1 Tax=Paenibacillus spongiae TaxID=2909671 RepID=A0ABY5SAE3_9BACL|nr:hypothetical protein [Paenibacillus spongiae]UVI29688.1 hypothetical protein L1F29_30475 [Paenibacillus spongiae]